MVDSDNNSRYEPEGEIARGGMGVVLRVKDIDLDRTLAMKRMASAPDATGGGTESGRFARFMEEAQVTAQLDHPAIVPVHELGFDDDGTGWYTMKLVEGRELGQIFDLARSGDDEWSLARVVRVLVQVCQALAYAHGKGVIHRDLKPANIMVGAFGEVYVMDWGLAKVEGSEVTTPRAISGGDGSMGGSLITLDGSVMGTPEFMPPEQARGEMEEVDEQSDVYSVGAMLYQLLSGKPPFLGDAREVIKAVVSDSPKPLPKSAPTELAAICNKAMAREKTERYGDASQLERELTRYLDGRVVEAHESGALAEFKKLVLRNKAIASVVSLLIFSLAAFAIVQIINVRKLDTANASLTDSLSNEALARSQAVETLGDMYVTAGLAADVPERAALWFASAASLVEPGSRNRVANRVRFETWSREAAIPVRAFRSKLNDLVLAMDFHPTEPFLLIHGVELAEVWNLMTEERIAFNQRDLFTSAACHPDRAELALGHRDGSVTLHSLPDMRVIEKVQAGEVPITQLNYSDDGGRLGIGSGVDLFVWDTEQRKMVGVQRQHPARIDWILFHKKMAVTAAGDQAFVFDLESETGAPKYPPLLHRRWKKNEMRAFVPAIYQDRLLTLGGPYDDWVATYENLAYTLHEWDLESGQEVAQSALSGLPTGVHQASGHVGIENFGFFNLVNRQSTGALRMKDAHNLSAISPDGRSFVGLKEAGTSRRLPDGKELRRIGTGFASAGSDRAITYNQNGRLLATCTKLQNEDSVVRVYRMWSEPRSTLIRGEYMPVEITLSADESLVAVVGSRLNGSIQVSSQTLRVHSSTTGDPLGPTLIGEGEVLCAEFDAQDEQIWIGFGTDSVGRLSLDNRPGSLRLWNWKTGRPASAAIDLPAEPLSITRSPDGSWYAVHCADFSLYRLDVDGADVSTLHRGSEFMERVDSGMLQTLSTRFLPDGTVVFAAGEAALGFLSPEQLSKKSPAKVVKTDKWMTAFDHAAGKVLAVDGISNQVSVINPLGGDLQILPISLGAPMTAIATDSKGATALVGSRDGTVRLMDLAKQQPIGASFAHSKLVDSLAFVPGCQWVISHGRYGSTQIWDPLTGWPVAPPLAYSSPEPVRIFPLTRSAGGQSVLRSPGLQGVERIDLSDVIEAPELALRDELLLAQINAGGVIRSGGVFEKFSTAEWFERWNQFREAHPKFHDRWLVPTDAEAARWHRSEALQFDPVTDLIPHLFHLRLWSESSDQLEPELRLHVLQGFALHHLPELLNDPVWSRDPETWLFVCLWTATQQRSNLKNAAALLTVTFYLESRLAGQHAYTHQFELVKAYRAELRKLEADGLGFDDPWAAINYLKSSMPALGVPLAGWLNHD